MRAYRIPLLFPRAVGFLVRGRQPRGFGRCIAGRHLRGKVVALPDRRFAGAPSRRSFGVASTETIGTARRASFALRSAADDFRGFIESGGKHALRRIVLACGTRKVYGEQAAVRRLLAAAIASRLWVRSSRPRS